MIVVTTETVAGKVVRETLGVVRGNTIRARHIGEDIKAVLRHVIGGEILEYTKLLAEAREQSVQRMIENAEEIGGNAVVGMRFITAGIMGGAAEIVAYGTAVKVE